MWISTYDGEVVHASPSLFAAMQFARAAQAAGLIVDVRFVAEWKGTPQ